MPSQHAKDIWPGIGPAGWTRYAIAKEPAQNYNRMIFRKHGATDTVQLGQAASYPSISIPDLLGRQLNDAESKNAPRNIFYSGSMKIPPSRVMASIIGSRQASGQGLAEAAGLSEFLTSHGAVIVSGLAKGIDTAAHKAAMSRNNATIAVLGTPLDRSYPSENTALQQEIMRNHLAISQYPVGHRTSRKDFVLRDKTMALISDITVIVEAGESSGTRYQGWEALRIGRPLFICRPVIKRHLSWPEKMLQCGAQMLEEHDGLLEFMDTKAKPELP